MQLPRYHRLRAAHLRLEGQRCQACGTSQFPPRALCARCGGSDLPLQTFSGRGTLLSYSELAHAPFGFTPPYLVGLVTLEEGPVVAAQLTDVTPGEVRLDMPLEMVTRRIREVETDGYLVYAYKFRPALGATVARR